MRILINRMLVTALLFFFSAASASALTVTMGGVSGQTVTTGDSLSVTVSLDVGTTTGITLLSIGVLFDDSQLSYDQAASTTTSYLLYGGKGGGGYLKASTTCGGYPQTAPAGCSLRVGTTNQVNVDFVSADLTNGTANTTGSSAGGAAPLLATLVFSVTGTGGSAAISLSQSSPGNVIGLAGGASTTATLAGSGSVNIVPEPTTALLVGLGLAGLAVAGRRKA